MTRIEHPAGGIIVAAVMCLIVLPALRSSAQQIPTGGSTYNSLFAAEGQPEAIGAPAAVVPPGDMNDCATCRNYNPVHRWQYHWKPTLCDYWHQPLIPARPFGASVRAAFGAQAASGVAAQMVLYRYDFEGSALSAHGRRQALRISEFLRMVPAPIVIEPSGDPIVDLARKRQVVELLQNVAGIPDVSDIVIVDVPRVRGLDGEEGRAAYNNMMRDLINGGAQYLNSNINNVSTQPVPSTPTTNINVR